MLFQRGYDQREPVRDVAKVEAVTTELGPRLRVAIAERVAVCVEAAFLPVDAPLRTVIGTRDSLAVRVVARIAVLRRLLIAPSS